jgi:hypothetical protein
MNNTQGELVLSPIIHLVYPPTMVMADTLLAVIFRFRFIINQAI